MLPERSWPLPTPEARQAARDASGAGAGSTGRFRDGQDSALLSRAALLARCCLF